jgi:hypothetical protein
VLLCKIKATHNVDRGLKAPAVDNIIFTGRWICQQQPVLSTADAIFTKNASLEDLLETRILYVTHEVLTEVDMFYTWYFLNISCSDVMTDL